MKCTLCHHALTIERLHCDACAVSLEGRFLLPRLARLAPASLQLAERFLLAGGNLKALAEELGISYPTLRKQVDEMIAELAELSQADARHNEQLLDAVEQGEISPEQAARHMKEQNGG